jgi:hypothetical protein
MATRIQDLRASDTDLFGATLADGHYRRCPVAAECARGDGGDARRVLAHERTKLYRNQNRDVVGRTA